MCVDQIGICMATAQRTGMITHVGCHEMGVCPYVFMCTQAYLDSLTLPAALTQICKYAFKR